MEEFIESDFITECLNNIFKTPCDNCVEREECSFEDKSKCYERTMNTRLQAERIA